jgi:ubiquinone/menaquinone biosynthesis C-methylase UbiE
MHAAREKVQRHYDEVAGMYDSRYDQARGRSYYTHICRHVMACLRPGGKLLDLGCGTGLFVQRYTRSRGSAVGLDLSRGMVERARRRCPGSEFSVGTVEALPFRDCCFDSVASILAFSYVREPQEMLSEAWRVLKPGGTIAICTLGRNLLTTGLPAVYTLGEAMHLRKIGMGSFGERYYTAGEMEDLFTGAGFSDVRVQRCSFAHINLIDPLFFLARRIEPFVEEKMPYLAYNLLASGTKPP